PRGLHSSPTRRSSDLQRDASPGAPPPPPGTLPSANSMARSLSTNVKLVKGRLYALAPRFVAAATASASLAWSNAGRFSRVLPSRSEEHTSELQSRENL